jgi:predicted secreted hydrolase
MKARSAVRLTDRPIGRRPPGRGSRALAFALAVAVLGAGCSTPILANDPIVLPSPAAAAPAPSRAADPIPISLPLDDGPHDRLTEWWYYTGHLHTPDGRRFGFEAVVFRAERGSVPAAWASHLALTDEDSGTFHYAQRSEVGVQVDHSPRDAAGSPTGFDLQIGGLSPLLVSAGAPQIAGPWQLAGGNGADHIEAALSPEEAAAAGASFGLRLDLKSTKPAALHDGDGFIDFGPAGSSYYYSRTRLAATGTLDFAGQPLTVEGIAWFDHQWGDFVSVGGGGWDWFAVNLDDGTDLTISRVRDAAGEVVSSYGTVVDPAGVATPLTASDFQILSLATWRSLVTGRRYPSNWRISIQEGLPTPLDIVLQPTVFNQELDTRATTGVVYWEGSQHVVVQILNVEEPVIILVGGEAYVEITRYGG